MNALSKIASKKAKKTEYKKGKRLLRKQERKLQVDYEKQLLKLFKTVFNRDHSQIKERQDGK